MNKSVEIIAEVAQGYEGNSKLSELLLSGALAANADAVKFQLVFADELCIPTYPYYDLFSSLEMEKNFWKSLIEKTHAAGKRFYFDIYGPKSLQWAHELGADGIKISTTDFYNTQLRQNAIKLFDRLYFSIGGVPIADVDELIKSCPSEKNVTLMHGFQAEPTETEDNHLRRISTLRNRYPEIKIGFMDHALGVSEEALYLPLVALGQGILCVEKHISLDPLLEVEDYISALTPTQFSKFAQVIRQMSAALGSEELELTEKETIYKNKAGKVVVAANDLAAGISLTNEHLEFKRASTQPNPDFFQKYSQVTGKTLNEGITKDQPFTNGQIS